MSAKPTIRDIAKSCGVAPSTVSRVLNNHPGEVGEETRQRILDVMRHMKYRTGQIHHTSVGKTYTLGIISGISGADYYHEGYFHSLIDSLLGVIAEYQQNGLIFAPHIFHDAPQQSIRSYCDGRCDGLLVMAPGLESLLVKSLRERGFPLVLIGLSGEDEAVSYCDIDNLHAISLGMEELLGLGHRRIALCQGPEGLQSVEQRRSAYFKSLSSAGIPVDNALISPMLADPGPIRDWLYSVMHDLSPEKRPTAILCFNDTHAGYVLNALNQMQMRIPEDISVIGIDDSGSAYFDPPLTTVSQPYREISLHAVAAVLAQITGEADVPQQALLPGQLIRRRSTAPPPSP